MRELVFVSHASADRNVAESICAVLERRGVPCWIATRDVPPGENFGDAIAAAIRTARVMVLVFSERANNSNEIKKEIVLAGRDSVPVIPVRVEDVQPSGAFEYELVTRQWIDLFDDWDQAIERLIRQIERQVASTDAARPAASMKSNQAHRSAAARRPEAAPARGRSGIPWLAGLGCLAIVAVAIAVFLVRNAGPSSNVSAAEVAPAPPIRCDARPRPVDCLFKQRN